jgi:cytochrome d ubiquinol oxidase subunit II
MIDLAYWLPLIFMGIMGLALFIYVILDGYDLGVGMLLPYAKDPKEKDEMVASIGPFWDANETWLVLGIGILLVAFPLAHGVVLTHLYIPVALMLFGLILRGVSFEFRIKVKDHLKNRWNHLFSVGSLIMTWSQGYMLGSYVMGFHETWSVYVFSSLCGVCLISGYCYMGASWVMMRTGLTQAVGWARYALYGMIGGIALISVATPLVSTRIFEKWMSGVTYLWPIPLLTSFFIVYLYHYLKNVKKKYVPFLCGIVLFLLSFIGLGHSFFPYVVPDQLTIWESASSTEALSIILIGALIVLPFILGYTFFVYRLFWNTKHDYHN